MKFNSINAQNGTFDRPCDLVAKFLDFEMQGGTLLEFLHLFDFESREEITDAVRRLAYAVAGDKYISSKYVQENNVHARCVFKRFNDICTKLDKFDKYPQALSGELWHGGYSRKRLQERTTALYAQHTPDPAEYERAAAEIMDIYALSAADVEKLHFFVEQTKAGAEFPNSLRRMLYIWGVAKMTGKTTSATMLVCLLNGDADYNNRAKYETILSNEMQIKAFAVPKIAECNACLMDECFYADMGKTYADFKRFITSSNGRARLPYGQEFEWQGQPNYIATSNDSLQKFIKDWNDRRFLSIEFKQKPSRELTLAEVFDLWARFVFNSTRSRDWKEWADALAPTANEIGERQERADEIALELQRAAFLEHLNTLYLPSVSPASPQNHLSLKWFVDYFAQSMGSAEAHKRRGEIEAAVLSVFGARYSSTNYWLASTIKAKGAQMLEAIKAEATKHPVGIPEQPEKLPF